MTNSTTDIAHLLLATSFQIREQPHASNLGKTVRHGHFLVARLQPASNRFQVLDSTRDMNSEYLARSPIAELCDLSTRDNLTCNPGAIVAINRISSHMFERQICLHNLPFIPTILLEHTPSMRTNPIFAASRLECACPT